MGVFSESITLRRWQSKAAEKPAKEDKKQERIEALVATAQAGSSEAFAKLYDIFVDPIYRYIYYRAGSVEAEDLTELVFLKTWENIRQYRSGKHHFSAWIFRIAHNIVVDFYRSKDTYDELPENIEDQRIEASAMHRAHRSLDRGVLDRAMMELKDSYRQIVVLKYLNDLSNDEIAEILGRSQSAVRILQFRALKKLRRILERMGISSF